MEDIIDIGHDAATGLEVADVTDVEFNLIGNVGISDLILMSHIVLLLFIAAEYAYLLDIGSQESSEYSVAERSGPSGDQKSLIFKN